MAIGKALKEFAQQQSFSVDKKYAYGLYRGYMTTFYEGMGDKSMVISAYLDDSSKRAIDSWLRSGQYIQRYSIKNYVIENSYVLISLIDNIGTMNRFKGILDMLTAYMAEIGVPDAEYCCVCGKKFGENDYNPETGESTTHGEKAHVHYHTAVLPMHSDCFNELAANTARKKSSGAEGSIGMGFIGAFLGALVGAIPWVLVQLIGYFVAVLGALVGFCSVKGYEMFHGRKSKVKILAVVVCSIIAVILAVYACEIISGMKAIAEVYKEYGRQSTLSEQFSLTVEMIRNNAKIKGIIAKDIGLGLLFAALGMYGVIMKLFKDDAHENDVPVRIDK